MVIFGARRGESKLSRPLASTGFLLPSIESRDRRFANSISHFRSSDWTCLTRGVTYVTDLVVGQVVSLGKLDGRLLRVLRSAAGSSRTNDAADGKGRAGHASPVEAGSLCYVSVGATVCATEGIVESIPASFGACGHSYHPASRPAHIARYRPNPPCVSAPPHAHLFTRDVQHCPAEAPGVRGVSADLLRNSKTGL